MYDNSCMKSDFKFWNAFRSMYYDYSFATDHPEYFSPHGLLLFTGPQGSGKTLSAVRYVQALLLKYPHCVLVSNMFLNNEVFKERQARYEGIEQLLEIDNGYAGILVLIDEIQTEFNSLESKGLDPSIFQIISQQRKRRLHVVGTSQLFSRIAKPWREQCNTVIQCKKIGKMQFNSVIDFDSIAETADGIQSYKLKDWKFFFHSPELYRSYDTYEKVKKVENTKGNRKK